MNLYGYTGNNPVNRSDPSGYMGGPGHGGPGHGGPGHGGPGHGGPGHGGPIPGWHAPVPGPRPPTPGWHSGKPGSNRPGDYIAFNWSVGLPFLSANGQIEVDRYGDWYSGSGGGVGTPGASCSLVVGTLNQSKIPSKNDLIDWMKGGGINVTGAFGIAGGETWSTDGNNNFIGSTEVGVGTPQISGSTIWTSPIYIAR